MPDYSGELCLKNKCHACCLKNTDGVTMWLTDKEFKFLKNNGTILSKDIDEHSSHLGKPVYIKDNAGRFQCTRSSDCSEIDKQTGRCKSYGKVRVCRETQPGGGGCHSCRRGHYLPVINI
jgi:hypothetical protein